MTTSATTSAAETAPTTTAPADDSALVADLESLISGSAPQASPPVAPAATPAAPQATPVPALQDAEAIPPDLEAQLVAQAKGRQAERAAHKSTEAMRAELAQLRQQLERAPGITAIAQAIQAKDPAAFAAAVKAAGLDPDAVQQLATRAKLAPPPAEAMAAAIEQAVAKALERAGVAQQQQQRGQPQPLDPEAVFETYHGYIEGAGERFPLQAAMGDYAGPAAVRYLRKTFIEPELYTAAEIDGWPHEKVAAMFEQHLAARSRPSQPPGAQPASGEPAATQPPGASTASGGPRPSATPTALTNGHAADVTRARPRTQREIDLELERELDQMMREA